MKPGKVRFAGSFGVELSARIDRPAGPPLAWVLFAHCFSCSKDLKAVPRISRALVERGFGVFRFDFTGLGESEGDFAETNFTSNLDDLVAAADFMREEIEPPRILVGHSLGGSAVLAAAPRIPESVAVATIGAPSSTDHLGEMLVRQAPELEASGEACVNLGGRPFKVKRQLIDDLEAHPLDESIADLGRALLILHSPIDEVVGIDHARRIYEAARHPKSFVSLDGADHLLLKRPADAEFVGSLLAAWSRRYLPARPETGTLPDEGTVAVRGGRAGFAQEIRARGHRLAADEPERLGGSDTGPTPYELLLAGLGACTSMTLKMYAKRKGWPLDEVRVRLDHDRIHASDCEDCESAAGQVDEIQLELTIEGDLDDAQRARLMEIATRCPVHRTLTNEIKIRTRSS